MPTARDTGQRQSRSQTALSAASIRGAPGGGGGGAAGAVNALVQQAQASQQQFQKLIQVVLQLQEENAANVQAAGQQAAGAATEVANTVASQIDKESQKSERKRERIEDRQFQEDFAKLQAKLQEDAKREARSMGAAIMAQREGIVRFANRFAAKQADLDEAIVAYAAGTDEMLAGGHFDSKEGREHFKKRLYLIEMSRTFQDNAFDDRHLEAAYQIHNDNIRRIIQGDDPMDLSKLRMSPEQLPMAKVEPSGRKIAEVGSLSPQEMFELKLRGGYPKGGVVFNQKPNFGLPEGYSPNMTDPTTMLHVLRMEDAYRVASDKSIRRELTRKNQEMALQALDRLEPLEDAYNSFNTIFSAKASGAIEEAIQEFIDNPNPHKFDDIARTLTSGAIKSMFGGGSNGEAVALKAMELFDGKAEMTTPQQVFGAMAIESALYNIQVMMLSEIQGAGAEGSSLATKLVGQLTEQVGEEEMSRILGVPEGGLVQAQDIMQQRLTDSYAFANRMHDGLWRQGVLESFRKDLKTYTTLADILSFKQVAEDGEQQGRVLELMGRKEALAEVAERVESKSPKTLEELVSNRETLGFAESLGAIDSLILLAKDVGPDALNGVSSMIAAGAESPETPNLQAYLDQTLVSQQRSGFIKAASKRARFSYDRQQKAKLQPTAGESFQKGGVPRVVSEQVPALVGLGLQYATFLGERTGAGLVHIAGGEEATKTFVRGLKRARGDIGLTKLPGSEPPTPPQQPVQPEVEK